MRTPGSPGPVEYLPGPHGKVQQVAAVEAHGIEGVALGRHRGCNGSGLLDPFEGVVCVDQEGAVVGKGACGGPHGLLLGLERLDEGVGHRA